MSKPFTDVTFPRQYPQRSIAEHEVLMSFNGDSDAMLFREWWEAKGAKKFGEYLAKRKKESPWTYDNTAPAEYD